MYVVFIIYSHFGFCFHGLIFTQRERERERKRWREGEGEGERERVGRDREREREREGSYIFKLQLIHEGFH